MPLDGNGYVRDGANTVSEREVEDHNRSEMQPPWEPSGGQTERILCYLMKMVMLVMMFRTEMMQMMKQHIRIVFEIVVVILS